MSHSSIISLSRYFPHLPSATNAVSTPIQFEDKAFRILVDTYVTDADGTGIVHQAPAFGEDDHRICIENGVFRQDEMPPCPIDDAGKFTSEVPDFAGQYVKVWNQQVAFFFFRFLIMGIGRR
jgi:isoleucyl-tRNA synthetase